MTTTEIKTFASRVRDAAESTPPAGRFCGDKVFIHAAWAIGRFGYEMSLEAFKSLLWEAHRAGLVELSRLDLVEAASSYDARRSRLEVMGTRWNLIRIAE